MDFSLIPFGLNVSDGEFMDVHDVPRGAKCGCICPSCKTPLIARQGNEKEWHFAHASRSVYEKTENECEFSFYVSVRMMARQIIGDELQLHLPEYKETIIKYDQRFDRAFSKIFSITDSKTISLTNVEVEPTFTGIPVDIVGRIGNFRFVVYFEHPGRCVPHELISPSDTSCGILAISLDSLSRMFLKVKKGGISYQSVLLDYLTGDVASKRWVFHPRYQRCREQAFKTLEAEIASHSKPHQLPRNLRKRQHRVENRHETNQFVEEDTFREERKRSVMFECVMCKSQWQGWEPGNRECPMCKTHLYSRTYKDDLKDEC